MTDLYPTPTRLALLVDIDAGRVRDDDDHAPHLHHDEGTSRVADAVWEMERARWVHQPTADCTWQLTSLGRDILEGRADG